MDVAVAVAVVPRQMRTARLLDGCFLGDVAKGLGLMGSEGRVRLRGRVLCGGGSVVILQIDGVCCDEAKRVAWSAGL
jgi:hypothetical protein